MDAVGAQELAESFLVISEKLQKAGDALAARQRLVDLAALGVDGCDWAALTMWPSGLLPHTPATTSQIAATVDEIQNAHNEGPCLAALSDDVPIYIDDLTVDDRWPAFSADVVAQTPVRTLLCLPLTHTRERSALNLYSSDVGALGTPLNAAEAAVFGAHARTLMIHIEAQERIDNLAVALDTNRQISTAVGILMALRHVSSDEGFALLVEASQRLRRKVRDVATDVNDTGTLPD